MITWLPRTLAIPRWFRFLRRHERSDGSAEHGTAQSALDPLRPRLGQPDDLKHADEDQREAGHLSPRERAVQDWGRFTVVPATRTFTDRLTLSGGIEVRHVGGNHAPDSTIVAIPDSGVMLLGDCFYPPPLHLRQPDDDIDHAQVEALTGEGLTWYVDSHNPPWRALP